MMPTPADPSSFLRQFLAQNQPRRSKHSRNQLHYRRWNRALRREQLATETYSRAVLGHAKHLLMARAEVELDKIVETDKELTKVLMSPEARRAEQVARARRIARNALKRERKARA